MLLDSVAPLVNTTSCGDVLISSANCPRARSTAFSVSFPYWWVREWGFPYCSVKYGSIASSTRKSTAEVAWLSRYNGLLFWSAAGTDKRLVPTHEGALEALENGAKRRSWEIMKQNSFSFKTLFPFNHQTEDKKTEKERVDI